ARCLTQRASNIQRDRCNTLTSINHTLKSSNRLRNAGLNLIRRESITNRIPGRLAKLLKLRNSRTSQPITKISHDRLHPATHRIKRIGYASKSTRSLVRERACQSSSQATSSRAHILERADSGLTSRLSSATNASAHCRFESLEVDLALRDHLRDFGRCLTQLLSQKLQNRDAARLQLHQIVALQLATSSNRAEDIPHLRHRRASNRSSIRNRSQNTLKLLPRFDTRSDSHRRSSSRLIKTVRSAFNSSVRILHNRGDIRRTIS